MLDDEEVRSYANEWGELTIGWLQMHWLSLKNS